MYPLPKPIGKLRIQWNEPWFFKQRTLSWRGWLIRVFLLGVGIVFGTGMMSQGSARKELTPIEWAYAVGIGVLVVLLMELQTFLRSVSIFEYDIFCVGVLTMQGGTLVHLLTGVKQWNRREIKQVSLLRPGETGNPFSCGLMIVIPKYTRPHQIGVPRSVSLIELADHLHTMGLAVELSEWAAAVETPIEA
jgi:hypothetical protein